MSQAEEAQGGHAGGCLACVVIAGLCCAAVIALSRPWDGSDQFGAVATPEQEEAARRARFETERALGRWGPRPPSATTWVHPARAVSLVLPPGWREAAPAAVTSPFRFAGPGGEVLVLELEGPLSWPGVEAPLVTDGERNGQPYRACQGGGIRLEVSAAAAAREAAYAHFDAIVQSLVVPAR